MARRTVVFIKLYSPEIADTVRRNDQVFFPVVVHIQVSKVRIGLQVDRTVVTTKTIHVRGNAILYYRTAILQEQCIALVETSYQCILYTIAVVIKYQDE